MLTIPAFTLCSGFFLNAHFQPPFAGEDLQILIYQTSWDTLLICQVPLYKVGTRGRYDHLECRAVTKRPNLDQIISQACQHPNQYHQI